MAIVTPWHFCNCFFKYHAVAPNKRISETNQFRPKKVGNAAEHFGLRSMSRRRINGEILMKNAAAAGLPYEHYVVRVDGRIKSHHRRFVDALREGLNLRDQFPEHDIKVQVMQSGSEQKTSLH
jgi:hypothetical protein